MQVAIARTRRRTDAPRPWRVGSTEMRARQCSLRSHRHTPSDKTSENTHSARGGSQQQQRQRRQQQVGSGRRTISWSDAGHRVDEQVLHWVWRRQVVNPSARRGEQQPRDVSLNKPATSHMNQLHDNASHCGNLHKFRPIILRIR
jgi:hypothetical protein